MGTRVEESQRHSSPRRSRRSNESEDPSRRRKQTSADGTEERRSRSVGKTKASSSFKSRRRPESPRRTSTRRSPSKSRRSSNRPPSATNTKSLHQSMPCLTRSHSPRKSTSRRSDEPRSLDLLNKERALHNLPPLVRTSFLDKIALEHAVTLARERVIVHSVASAAELHVKLHAQTSVAENVQSGQSMQEMHEITMMQVGSSSYNNILGLFEEVGIGKARGKDGRLYMCQVFRTK
jgi:uncharacterized protein YkwD